MTDHPIRLGSILFTVVEPHRGHEVAYNRWYERDHFYAGCMVGPGILAGRRWVATKPYKEVRFPESGVIAPDRMTGSYLATYWIERGQQDEWGTWAAKEVHRLHEAGRMFAERDHVHTKMYRYRGGVFRDADGVPPELALDHPYAGLVAVIGRAHAGRDELLAWYLDEHLPRALEASPVAMTLLFTPVPIPDEAPADVPRQPDDAHRFLLLSFCEQDPLEIWQERFASEGKALEGTGLGEVLWASPFIPTIPGTDVYTDQLR